MIVEFFMDVLLAVAGFVLGVLPEGEPLGLGSASGLWIGYTWFNSWLPAAEILAAIAIFVGAHALMYAALGIMAVWRLLPFKFS